MSQLAKEFTAEFSQSRNDLYWKLYAGEDGFIRWTGYDDANWWNNVSATDRARVRTGKVSGRTFTIDFKTNAVVAAHPAAHFNREEASA